MPQASSHEHTNRRVMVCPSTGRSARPAGPGATYNGTVSGGSKGSLDRLVAESTGRFRFLTPAERRGEWRHWFGQAAARLPEPYRLFGQGEQPSALIGFPIRISPGWESLSREVAGLLDAEVEYRCSLTAGFSHNKAALIERRGALAHRFAELLENAVLHDFDRRLPELLWLLLCRETSSNLNDLLRLAMAGETRLPARFAAPMRFVIAQRLTEVLHRGEVEALARLRRWDTHDLHPGTQQFAQLLRRDILPFALPSPVGELADLDPFLNEVARVDASRFRTVLHRAAEQLERLLGVDPALGTVLDQVDPGVTALPAMQRLLSPSVLKVLSSWHHRDVPSLPDEMVPTLNDLAGRLRRLEVIHLIIARLYPVTERGSTVSTVAEGTPVTLSSFTRPMDFSATGVVDSAVRRYGLLYDLVEFTQLLEELRRRGRSFEENAMRFMVRFHREMEAIQQRHRLTFEKFLGDGAFWSGRSARGVMAAATELRVVYERLRHQGFPFDRGLRLALNVGTYHLIPMSLGRGDGAHFEFFGHGLVELARLTTGKTTREVEDIADFLIASGYDVHKVLQFLEPVRHQTRYSEQVRQRPYAAFLAENGELVNLGGVATEPFLTDLEAELSSPTLFRCRRFDLEWLLLPASGEPRPEQPWVGLRSLGTARLKGLDPLPLAEVVVFEEIPDSAVPVPAGGILTQALRMGTAGPVQPEDLDTSDVGRLDPRLCVVSTIEGSLDRAWYIGLYLEQEDALQGTFRIPLTPVDLGDGEPFESWLFRRRGELAKLYRGLRRSGSGVAVALSQLRDREGYFTCLLSAPHRSPR